MIASLVPAMSLGFLVNQCSQMQSLWGVRYVQMIFGAANKGQTVLLVGPLDLVELLANIVSAGQRNPSSLTKQASASMR